MAAPISDLYERYKIGTKRVVQWLAETAGKSSSAVAEATVMVSTREIEVLANIVLDSATVENVRPRDIDSIISILEDVIAGRSECAVWYQLKTAEDERDEKFERSQKGHRHFIDVMRAVLGRLKEAFSVGVSKPGKRKTPPKHLPDTAGNAYQGLDVEEPSADFLAAAAAMAQMTLTESSASPDPPKSSKKSKKKKKTSTAPTFELEPQKEDGEFALWCLLKDCHQTRLYVRGLWQEYAAGNVSFHIAARITDNAFLLVKHATSEFARLFPALSTMEQLADHLNIDASIKGRSIESFQCKGSAQENLSTAAVDLLCIPAFLHLVLLGKPIYPEDDFKVQQQMDYRESAHPFTRVTSAFAQEAMFRKPELCCFLSIAGLDTFTQELLKALSGPLPLHIVIQFQAYMDIVETTDTIIGAPWNAMLGTKRLFEVRISTFEARMIEHNQATHAKSSIREFVKEIMTQGLDDYAHLTKRYGDPDSIAMLDSPWVSALPVFGGVLVGKLIGLMYVDGLMAADKNSIVLSVAHLYHACRTSGMLKHPWKDMDFFIASIGPKNLRLPPSGYSFSALSNSAHQYGIAMGASQHTKKFNSRVPLPLPEQMEQGRVVLLPDSVTINQQMMATKRSLHPSETMNIAARNALLREANFATKLHAAGIDAETRQYWQTCGKIAPIGLLKTLKAAMEGEETMIYFNFHSLTIDCMNLLNTIKASPFFPLHHKLAADSSAVQLTDEILWEAQLSARAAPTTLRLVSELMEFRLKGNKLGDQLFRQACAFRDSCLRYDPKTDLTERILRREANVIGSKYTKLSVTGRDVAIDHTPYPAVAREERQRQQERAFNQTYKVFESLRAGMSTEDALEHLLDSKDSDKTEEGAPKPLEFTAAEIWKQKERMMAMRDEMQQGLAEGLTLEECIRALRPELFERR